MQDCRPAKIPMRRDLKIEFSPDEVPEFDDEFTHEKYRKGTGYLQFLVTCCRTDIAYAVNYLSRFNSRPNKECWSALKHLLRYLKGTKKKGIIYKKGAQIPQEVLEAQATQAARANSNKPRGADCNEQADSNGPDVPNDSNSYDPLRPVAWSDSDWAGADPAFKSTSGYVITMNGSPVSWRSQRQTSVSKSSTEAEYIAASEAACELVWLNDLLIDAGIISEGSAEFKMKVSLKVDNKGAIDPSKTEALTRRSRHIEIRYHLLRDWVDKEENAIEHVSTSANIADGLTKPLPIDPFESFRERVGISTC